VKPENVPPEPDVSKSLQEDLIRLSSRPLPPPTAQLVASGTVIGFRHEPVRLVLPLKPPLEVIFDFVDEKLDKPFAIPRIEGANRLRVAFIGFDDAPLGRGSVQPLHVAQFVEDQRKLWLHYRVYTLQGSDPTVHYAFYVDTKPKKPEEPK
jgi:hypothetical protein